MGATRADVTSRRVPAGISTLTAIRSWSVAGKKSERRMPVMGSASETKNRAVTIRTNFQALRRLEMSRDKTPAYHSSTLWKLTKPRLTTLSRKLGWSSSPCLPSLAFSTATDSAGFTSRATTSDDSSVTVMTNGMEKMNLPMMPVMNSIAAKIHTTVSVVETSTRW